MKGVARDRDFFAEVYAVVGSIPAGRVTSYGAIAKFLGHNGSARMVGYALQHIPATRQGSIPAHRVLNRNGLLSGKHHFGGDRMAGLLQAEGLQVNQDRVADFNVHFWDPALELPASF